MKAAFRHGKPFIKPEDAHLNIGFSCISYLNTSFQLLPQHSNEEQRIRWVLQGLHGLQVYANQSWHKHIVAYMDLVVAQNLAVPEYLAQQLGEILKYSKVKSSEEMNQSSAAGTSAGQDILNRQYQSLTEFSGLCDLVSRLEGFRNDLRNQDWTQKSIEGKPPSLNTTEPILKLPQFYHLNFVPQIPHG
jgi:hypothetical protein